MTLADAQHSRVEYVAFHCLVKNSIVFLVIVMSNGSQILRQNFGLAARFDGASLPWYEKASVSLHFIIDVVQGNIFTDVTKWMEHRVTELFWSMSIWTKSFRRMRLSLEVCWLNSSLPLVAWFTYCSILSIIFDSGISEICSTEDP